MLVVVFAAKYVLVLLDFGMKTKNNADIWLTSLEKVKKIEGMDVESTNRSLINPEPKSLQHLEQDVAVPFLTLIDSPSSEKTKDCIKILLCLLNNITRNVMSGDVMWLSCYNAEKECVESGLDEEFVKESISNFMKFAKKNRSGNPLSKMF